MCTFTGMLEFGEICEIDAQKGMVKVYIPETTNVTEWIPFMRPYYAQSIPIDINEQVIVGCTGSGRWFVLGCTPNSIDQPYTGATADKYGVKFPDGTLIEYNRANGQLSIQVVDDIQITSAANVTITAAGEIDITSPVITLTGAVTVIGVLSASGGIELSEGAGMTGTGGGSISTDGEITSGGISLSTHIHGGVTTGAGTTSTPIAI